MISFIIKQFVIFLPQYKLTNQLTTWYSISFMQFLLWVCLYDFAVFLVPQANKIGVDNSDCFGFCIDKIIQI